LTAFFVNTLAARAAIVAPTDSRYGVRILGVSIDASLATGYSGTLLALAHGRRLPCFSSR
jgi:hypothetical protein